MSMADEEKRLISAFGGGSVHWTGDGWAVGFEGQMFKVPTGVVSKYGVKRLKEAMGATPMTRAIAALDRNDKEAPNA